MFWTIGVTVNSLQVAINSFFDELVCQGKVYTAKGADDVSSVLSKVMLFCFSVCIDVSALG